MSYNVLNKKFLSVLLKINVDVEVFPDRTFDSLFESSSGILNYFLEWFVENIDGCNALTVKEKVAASENFDCKSESNIHVTFEELDTFDGNGMEIREMAAELAKLSSELIDINVMMKELEQAEADLTQKSYQYKETCKKTGNNLLQVVQDVHFLNSRMRNIADDVISFKSKNYFSPNEIELKLYLEQWDNLVESLPANSDLYTYHLMPNLSVLNTLEDSLVTAQYLSIVSKGKDEQKKVMLSKGEEFLMRLRKYEKENFFVFFDEFFSEGFYGFRGSNECKEDYSSTDDEASLINALKDRVNWNVSRFECNHLPLKLDKLENQISELNLYQNGIKMDTSCNIILSQITKKMIENEYSNLELIRQLHSKINRHHADTKDETNKLEWKQRRYQEFHLNLKEKNAFLNNYQSKFDCLNGEELALEKCKLEVESLLKDPAFSSSDFIRIIENFIACFLHDEIHRGPTNQLQIAPIELFINFQSSEELSNEFSHDIQRILTEYINIKESVSKNDRSKAMLWSSFLKMKS